MEENQDYIPPQPHKSFRVTLELTRSAKRLDVVLLEALRNQKENLNLFNITRTTYKQLFLDGRVVIKGQRAKVSSSVAKGITYVDILGY